METDKKTQSNVVRSYQRYLKLQRGFSPHTVEAYQRDLEKLLNYLKQEGKPIDDVQLEDLQHFAATLHELGIGPSSQCRILSGVRSFFRFLELDGWREDDPSELLESPVLGEHLPEVLSEEEVDMLEGSIDLSKWEGQRNKAIIEVLFSCGLRVSELVNLKLSSIYVDEQYVRVMGKGSKERLVPIQTGRGGLCVPEQARGAPHAHYDINYDKAAGGRGGHSEDHLAPHPAPLVCHCPAGRRSRPACHPGHAGP